MARLQLALQEFPTPSRAGQPNLGSFGTRLVSGQSQSVFGSIPAHPPTAEVLGFRRKLYFSLLFSTLLYFIKSVFRSPAAPARSDSVAPMIQALPPADSAPNPRNLDIGICHCLSMLYRQQCFTWNMHCILHPPLLIRELPSEGERLAEMGVEGQASSAETQPLEDAP